MKKIFAVIMALIMTMGVFAGCAESCSLQKEEPTVVTTPVASTEEFISTTESETSPTENYTESMVSDDGFILVPAAKAGVYIAVGVKLDGNDLVDPFDAMNDSNVQSVQYSDFGNLLDTVEETEFGRNGNEGKGELRLYQSANNVHIGWLGDVMVGDFTIGDEDFVWHFRAETVEQMENRTGIVIPSRENMSYHEELNGSFIEKADYYYMSWWVDHEADASIFEGNLIDMFIIYFPKTHHQYTFYSQEVRYEGEYKNYYMEPGRVVQELGQDRECYGY